MRECLPHELGLGELGNNRKTRVKRPKDSWMHNLSFFYLKDKLVILLYLKKYKDIKTHVSYF